MKQENMLCTSSWDFDGWVIVFKFTSETSNKFVLSIGHFKFWVSRLTNKIVHMNPICSFWGSFPSLLPCPCVMLTPFHVSPSLLAPTVWRNKLPSPDIHFPSRDVGEKVRHFSPQRRQRIHFHQRFINFPNSMCIFNGSLCVHLCTLTGSNTLL